MKTFLCSHLVTLKWNSRQTVANLERISPTLASLNAEEPLPLGAAVTISTGAHQLLGHVVKSELDLSGHLVDLELTPPWSPQDFSPDHLFDPDTLLGE